MKMTKTDRRPCRMVAGDLRRVPQDCGRGLIGYYFGCPRCGFVNIAVHGADGVSVGESAEGPSLSVPLRCVKCRGLIRIAEGGGKRTPLVR